MNIIYPELYLFDKQPRAYIYQLKNNFLRRHLARFFTSLVSATQKF